MQKQNKTKQNTTENQKAFQALPFAQVARLMSFPQLPCPGGTVSHLLAAAQNLKAKPGSKTHQPLSMQNENGKAATCTAPDTDTAVAVGYCY